MKVVNHRKPIKYSQRYSQRVHLSHATSRTVLVGLMGSWKSFFFLQFFSYINSTVVHSIAFDRLRIVGLDSWAVGQLAIWSAD